MSFYKSIEPFTPYIFSIRKLKDYFTFDMIFPSKWTIPKGILDKLQTVDFQSENTENKGISFVTEINEEKINITLDSIGKIIKLNKEREIKEKLFKQTVEQLKQTFEKTDLDQLKKLYFDFEKDENFDLDEQDGQESATIELAE